MNRSIANLAGASLLPLLCSCGGGVDEAPAQAQACSAGRACVSTVAGTGELGAKDGKASTAQFWFPHALAIDASGALHVAEYGNAQRFRVITADGSVSTQQDDEIAFAYPETVAVDASGTRYVVDTDHHQVLKVLADGSKTVIAGGKPGDVDGDASTARFVSPTGIAIDAHGDLYVADSGNSKIRKISLPTH